MEQSTQQDREIRALRDRIARLSEASALVNQNLDFDDVLQRVLEAARLLTDAGNAVMILRNAEGRAADILSSGFNSDERRRLWRVPEAQQVSEYLSGLVEPLRLADLKTHIRARGFSEWDPPRHTDALSFLAVPMFHRDDLLGHILVGEKADGEEFSEIDEQTLVMFASQAAMVINNSAVHRNERSIRSDLRTLVEVSPVGIVVFDAQTGRPKLLNREARRIAGVVSEDVPLEDGPLPDDLVDTITCVAPDGRDVSLRESPVAEAIRAGESVSAQQVALRARDGATLSTLINVTPVYSSDEQLSSFVLAVQDMTLLEQRDRTRAEFLDVLSHELSVPLATLKGSITTLLESADDLGPAEMRQFFDIIGDQADQIRGLVNDLVDVTRIELGALSVTPEPADVYSLVDDASAKFASSAGGGGGVHACALATELEDDLPVVMADQRRVLQVLRNLLFNAAQRSGNGSQITLSAQRLADHVAFSVADSGRAVPGGIGGAGDERSGLGLNICKGIVEAHGGRLQVDGDSAEGGSRLTFTLPTAAAPTVAVMPPLRQPQPSARGQVRVLVVDDDPQTLAYVRDLLVNDGYAPITTSEPSALRRLMVRDKPHLVLLDLLLGGNDGLELMNTIHKTADVPVVFLSTYGQDEAVAKALEMGASDYLVKPFSPTELAARIKMALRKQANPFPEEPPGPYDAAGLQIDYPRRRVTLDGTPVDLTATEYAVLYELAVHAPRVMTHSALLHRAWGPERVGEPWLVRDIIKRIRRKLGDDADNPTHILTEPRVGYRMTTQEPPPTHTPAPKD